MTERTGYAERHQEEYPPGQETLDELEYRLRERAGDQADIWPGRSWERTQSGAEQNFHDSAREWWRENGAGMDLVNAELAMYRHDAVLDQRLADAREMGVRVGEALQDMVREGWKSGYRIEAEDARLVAEEAADGALRAQEVIGHDLRSRDRYGEWSAYTLQEELERRLAQRGGRGIDPADVGSIFAYLETVVQHGERILSLENDPGASESPVWDRSTQELVDWAVQNGEHHRWAEGRRLGWSADETSRQLDAAIRERENTLWEAHGRAPDPVEDLPAHLLEWGRQSGRMEGWVVDYQEVLDALNGEEQANLPDWATTTRGQLRRRGSEQMREAVEQRAAAFREMLGGEAE